MLDFRRLDLAQSWLEGHLAALPRAARLASGRDRAGLPTAQSARLDLNFDPDPEPGAPMSDVILPDPPPNSLTVFFLYPVGAVLCHAAAEIAADPGP